MQVKDDGAVLNAKVIGIQRKWNDICRRLNHTSQMAEADISRVGPQILPRTVGFPGVADRNVEVDNCSSSVHLSQIKNLSENISPSISMGSQKFFALNQKIPKQLLCEGKDDNIVAKLEAKLSKSEYLQTEGLSSPASTVTSVTTDLGLGTVYSLTAYKEPDNPMLQTHKERIQDLSGCSSSNVDMISTNVSSPPIRPSSFPSTCSTAQFDLRDFKTLWRSLTEKVGRQSEVIYDISEMISHCRTGNGRCRGTSLRGDIWFSFLGPDMVAKRRIAGALAEIIFGNKRNLTFVDLSSEDGVTRSSTMFSYHEINGYDVQFRGKTVVDYIAEEISKKPLSIVFLENVDKADLMAQNSLTRAITTGKFPNCHGREIGINNTIFITTTGVLKDSKTISSENQRIKFSEERILRAGSWQMQILIGRVLEGTAVLKNSRVLVTSRTVANKRKLTDSNESLEQPEIFDTTKRACKTSDKFLDLNLPAQDEIEENDTTFVNNEERSSLSENSESWLESFFDQVDKNVVFKPFDFDTLADEVLKEISKCLRHTFDESTEVLLEIDSNVMEQILAAAWLSDNKATLEDWVNQVLGQSFEEIRQQRFRGGDSSGFVLKLVACEGLLMEKEASGICLPAAIILNLK